jgi:hypothetical protein
MVGLSCETPLADPQAAVAFLRRYGHASLISLGCGPELNRLDNHLRLFAALNLTYYVGIDCVPAIAPGGPDRFVDPEGMNALLSAYYEGQPQRFQDAVRVFPNTWVEELAGIHCAAVVCQRVLPDCRWEEVILSMTPKLILQEDLHGCERQQLRGRGYVRAWRHIRRYDLQPFRPWPVFPGERNLILWRRRDFEDQEVERSRWRWWWRLCERCLG